MKTPFLLIPLLICKNTQKKKKVKKHTSLTKTLKILNNFIDYKHKNKLLYGLPLTKLLSFKSSAVLAAMILLSQQFFFNSEPGISLQLFSFQGNALISDHSLCSPVLVFNVTAPKYKDHSILISDFLETILVWS